MKGDLPDGDCSGRAGAMPLVGYDLLTIRVAMACSTPAKMEHVYTVHCDGLKLATGHVTLALVDREGRIQRVPDWLRQLGR